MNPSSYNQQFLGFLRLKAGGEIDTVDPYLFEQVSSELKDWVGLPFMQWLNYAFLQVSDLNRGECGGLQATTLVAGKPQEDPEYVFRLFSAADQQWVQVCRLAQPVASAKHPGVSMIYGEADETCLRHFWNQLLSWMIPGFLHDANNHLSALVSLGQCLTDSVEEGSGWNDEQKEDLESMLQCGKETGGMFLFLSKVYKWNTSHENYHDLSVLFSDIVRLVDIALPSTFTVDSLPAVSGMHVYLNPVHLAQLILGQLSVWFPDRNQRPQGTIQLRAGKSLESDEGFAELVGERPPVPCWVIEWQMDDGLARKRTPVKGSEFQTMIQPLLLKKLQGAFMAHQREPRWVLELPQAHLTES